MAVIKVPKTPRKSFDPDRRPSALLLDQIRHLEWAALPARQRAPGKDLPTKTVKTEGDAAERIAQLTALVLEQQARPYTPGQVPKVTLPPLPGTAAPKARRARKTRTVRSARKPTRKGATTSARTTSGTRQRAATKAAPKAAARKRGRRGKAR